MQICYICKEKFEDKHAKDKKYCKVRDHYHYTGEYTGAANRIFDLKYIEPKEISIVFHSGSNFNLISYSHFIIKE